MLPIKNSLKSLLRTPGKTLLFTAVLAAVAVLLSVSFCVYAAARGYLWDAEDYFHTVAELEYLGEQYPERDVYDPAVSAAVEENREDLEALLADEAVLSFEPDYPALGMIEGLHRTDQSTYETSKAVIGARIMAFNEVTRTYTAIVGREYYSLRSYYEKLVELTFYDPEEPLRGTADGTTVFPWEAPELETGRRYVLSGYYVRGRTAASCFVPEEISFADAAGSAVTSGWVETEDYELPEDSEFLRLARVLHLQNDGCRVSYTAALEDTIPFHQQQTRLMEGRFFTEGEYAARAPVCVLSQKLAGRLDVKTGDRISMEVLSSDGDLYDASSLYPVEAGDYEIVGICTEAENYPLQVWLPGAKETGLGPVTGYTLGQLRLDNEKTSAFLRKAEALEARGFRISVYDQGYAAATEPIRELLYVSVLFLAVCLLLAACALALQSHLFISRQRETGKTMYALGSGKTHVCVFFLSAALAIVLPSALFGALIGSEAEGWVFDVLQRFAAQFANQDLRFSATRLAIVRTLDFSPNFSLGGYLTAAGILAGGTLIFTLFYALSSLREKKSSKKKPVKQRAPKKIGKVSRLSGPFKYGLLSLRRSHARTVAVLALGLAVALFFGQLTSSLADYQAQLETYKANASISGSATDFYGKRLTGLTLTSHAIVRLSQSDLVEDPCVTRKLGHITFIGVLGTDYEPYVIPEPGTFAYAKAFYVLNKSPVWTGTSSIVHSPLFHYSKSSAVEWLDGWSEEDFTRLETRYYRYYDSFLEEEFTRAYRSGPEICAMPKAMMEEYGLKLGDTIDTVITYTYVDDEIIQHLTLKVVASYVAPKGSATVFSPVSFVSPGQELLNYFPSIRYGESGDVWIARERWPQADMETLLDMGLSAYMDYSSFTFNLTDSTRLDELRQTMSEAGFTWVHSGERIKTFATIEDEVYINTTHSMERQIQYVRVLYNALYFLAGVIGFALAWLLIQSRRQEIAVMRALGTQPGRIVGSFLAEQLLLMALGLAIGAALSRLAGTPLSQNQLLLTAAFLGVWTLSALICLIVGLRKKSFAALTEPE